MDTRAQEVDNGEHIAAVLDAERDAEAAVEQAKREAQDSVERARARARAIRDRAERRIRGMTSAASDATERHILALRAEEAQRRERLSQRGLAPDRVRAAAGRVADWLLGAS